MQALSTRAARRLNRGCAWLSAAVLADSAVEHYRGMFFNRAMYAPLAVSSLTLAASVHGGSDRSGKSHPVRDGIYALAALTGLAGTGFHLYNVGKREGGFSFENLFYCAPVGAPFALLLAGLFGRAAERVRDTAPGDVPQLFGLPAGRALAGASALGMMGTVGEVGLLHFRGAYHDPFMFLPVSVPPAAAATMAAVAVQPKRPRWRLARLLLRLVQGLGFAGVGFHAYGVHRNMGGWRNWSQTMLNGPPLPAPPSFTGLALVGLAALDLLEERHD
ncbi:MAG: hypothetical protein J0H14_23500 [Alphaproteobacteria bacterium]|nr:hypothetical protein [Alphaproteobacteria bacterium]